MEECEAEIEIISHFYTTDFFVRSAFNNSQIISVYYKVKNITPLNFPVKTTEYDFEGEGDVLQAFRWVNIARLSPDDVTFPADKHVVELLKAAL